MIPQGAHSIHIHDLNYSYPEGGVALAGVGLDIAEGTCVGLVGANGAGKTTLFLCLAGVLPIPAGKVRLAGLDPGVPADRRKLPHEVGIVFQHSDDQIFNATVLDDVAFGPLNLGLPPAEVRLRVQESLARVGLSGYEERVPFHLSGGEKRRVALAGVLAMRPGVLLLDEPSIYLDPRGRRELLSLVQGMTVTRVIASHDLEWILRACSRVIVLDRGRVVADGPTRSILGDMTLMERHGLEVPYSLQEQAPQVDPRNPING